ncbi:MAG: WXG100 family type VII secretion target [Mycobacterium sp.]
MTDRILYDHGTVSALSSTVGNQASTLQSIHDDIKNQTDAIAEFFQGQAATSFREQQLLMLNGFQGLIEVMLKHGHTIEEVRSAANAVDVSAANLFG